MTTGHIFEMATVEGTKKSIKRWKRMQILKAIIWGLAILAWIVAIIVLSALDSDAAPFLVCDPQTNVDTYKVFIDGVEVANDVPAESDGSLRYHLFGLEPGAYEFKASACNAWGCSDPSDPYVSPPAATVPSNLRLAE